MAGLLLFDLTLAVGVTSMSAVSNTAMMSIRSNGCTPTSVKDDSDSDGAGSSSDFKSNDVATRIAEAFASAGFSKAATAGYWATCMPNPVSWQTEAAATMATVLDNGLPEAKSALGWTLTGWGILPIPMRMGR